ncbi:MAG: SRPBCC family protein [Actinopolymorphaceae bacterium]
MSDDVHASIEIAADPRAVYDIVTDVAQLPRWAVETVSCRWLDGADGPVVGARFRGVNRNGPLRW